VEDRKALIRKYVSKGMKVAIVAGFVGMSKSSYYYKHRRGRRGRKPSTETLLGDKLMVPNEQVVVEMKSILGTEFLENGYRKVTNELKDMDYHIGKTKTFRLMKENRLLLPRKKKSKREFVRFTQPLPLEPFEKLEMDIKFVYIRGERKNALLITILDTFTRIALAWDLQYSIRHSSVGRLFTQVIDQWLQDYRPPFGDDLMVTLRCDNDGRFVAHELQTFLSNNFINQEFILPATPQQNAHIESFHSVFEELVCKKYDFEDIHHCREVLVRFYPIYNHRRSISSLLYLPPAVFLNEWQNGNVGLNMKKIRGKVLQKFFFRGQRPKWRSALAEDILMGGICKDINDIPIFVKPTLNES
jgi:transposase InsO family protein